MSISSKKRPFRILTTSTWMTSYLKDKQAVKSIIRRSSCRVTCGNMTWKDIFLLIKMLLSFLLSCLSINMSNKTSHCRKLLKSKSWSKMFTIAWCLNNLFCDNGILKSINIFSGFWYEATRCTRISGVAISINTKWNTPSITKFNDEAFICALLFSQISIFLGIRYSITVLHSHLIVA